MQAADERSIITPYGGAVITVGGLSIPVVRLLSLVLAFAVIGDLFILPALLAAGGKFFAPLARIKGVFRYQILVRGPERGKLREAVARGALGRSFPGVDVVVDVDPINIL